MLFVIALRNLIELSGSTFSLLPTSFVPVMPSMSILQSIFSPALIVILSEMLVDWLKHAFITKFNHSEPPVPKGVFSLNPCLILALLCLQYVRLCTGASSTSCAETSSQVEHLLTR